MTYMKRCYKVTSRNTMCLKNETPMFSQTTIKRIKKVI